MGDEIFSKKNGKVAVVGSADISDYFLFREYMQKCDYLICCDGGMKHFYNCDIVPDIIIGDLDSAESSIISYFEGIGVVFEKFPCKKDFTDMELGLRYAVQKGACEIFVFGGIGSRLDHSLANAHILKFAEENGVRAWLINEKNFLTVVGDEREIEVYDRKGSFVSLIPLTSEVLGVYTKGLEYCLSGETMKIGSSLGISNVALEPPFFVAVERGFLFVIIAED